MEIESKRDKNSMYVYCIEQDKIYRDINDIAKENKVSYLSVKHAVDNDKSLKGLTFIKI